VTELSTHLQKLEKGEFGLPEALAEARELKRCVLVRDADIARLIKTTNQLQNSLDELSDQNLALRFEINCELVICIYIVYAIERDLESLRRKLMFLE
jgi:hypothetical protein